MERFALRLRCCVQVVNINLVWGYVALASYVLLAGHLRPCTLLELCLQQLSYARQSFAPQYTEPTANAAIVSKAVVQNGAQYNISSPGFVLHGTGVIVGLT